MSKYYLYITRYKDNSLYIGISNNPKKRIKRHNNGQGAKWIKQYGKAKLVYVDGPDSYLKIHRREI